VADANKLQVTPTVKEVCVMSGPAYGACWGCPVNTCPLWIEPNPVTALYEGVALKAAQRLAENRTVVEGVGGRSFLEVTPELVIERGIATYDVSELAAELSSALLDPDVKKRLQIWTAAEAAVLRVPALRSALVKAEDQYLRDWMRAYNEAGKSPTDSEVMVRDERVDRLEAAIAAQVYGIPKDEDAVREAIAFIKGHRLKPTLEYRRDHTR
jgi:hypothetical protein